MILNKGLWISITLDGIEASISQTYKGHAFLTLYGPEREKGNLRSAYSLFGGLPADGDSSPFAVLYRKLNGIAKEIGMEGLHGENHPAVFRRFEYIYTELPVILLEKLTQSGIVIRVAVVDHKAYGECCRILRIHFSLVDCLSNCPLPNPHLRRFRSLVHSSFLTRHCYLHRSRRLLGFC